MKRLRILAGWGIIVLTVLVFINFIRSNPGVWWQLQKTRPSTIIFVLLGYAAMTGVLTLLYKVMTDICKVNIPAKENMLLTMYSNVVNFFGPLQSGPGFRLVYLKRKYKINVPAYIGVSLLYYVCFAVVSGLMLLSGVFGWWILALFGLAVVSIYFGMPKVLRHPRAKKLIPQILPIKALGVLMMLSIVQVFVVAVIYFTELRSLSGGVSFGQAIIYTGAANFALFVSLTPGALGFRESFLYFSRDLHGINESTIVAANILDRGVYVVFLGILFLVILGMHGHKKLTKVVPESSLIDG